MNNFNFSDYQSAIDLAIRNRKAEVEKAVYDALDKLGYSNDYILNHVAEFIIKHYPIHGTSYCEEYYHNDELLLTVWFGTEVGDSTITLTWSLTVNSNRSDIYGRQ